MFKYAKGILVSALALCAMFTSSCNSRKDSVIPADVAVTSQQNSLDALVETMSADQLVKDYFLSDIMFAKGYADWFNNLTESQKQARISEVKLASQNGGDIVDPAHSPTETETYIDLQAERASQIKNKYPQFAELSNDDYGKVQSAIYSKIISTVQMTGTTANRSCLSGYTTCVAYCRNVINKVKEQRACINACTNGYFSCIN